MVVPKVPIQMNNAPKVGVVVCLAAGAQREGGRHRRCSNKLIRIDFNVGTITAWLTIVPGYGSIDQLRPSCVDPCMRIGNDAQQASRPFLVIAMLRGLCLHQGLMTAWSSALHPKQLNSF